MRTPLYITLPIAFSFAGTFVLFALGFYEYGMALIFLGAGLFAERFPNVYVECEW